MNSEKNIKKRKNIPASAKCVFKGVIFDVWQWKQKMFDGSLATFERLERPDRAQIIPIVGNKILIEIQEQPDSPEPFVTFPGGRCDKGEKPIIAAKRELFEETGFVSKDWSLWKEVRPYFKIYWMIHTYIARDCKLKTRPQLDPGEKISTKLISFDEFIRLSDNPKFCEKDIIITSLRARLDKRYRDELHSLFFKK